MTTAAAARRALEGAWSGTTGAAPTLPELQIVQAVAALESHWGDAYPGTNNWGSVKCSGNLRPPCGPDCFEHGDLGGQFCFRRYGSPEAGAADLIRLVTVRRPTVWEALRAGDTREVAARMSATHYFEADPTQYGQALQRWGEQVARELGETLAIRWGGGAGGSSALWRGVAIVGGAAAAYWAARRLLRSA